MHRRSFVTAIAVVAATALGLPGEPHAKNDMKLSGPFTHENLAVYFVHGESTPGPVPLTLAEALAKGAAQVYETGNVQELFVENTGSEELFIQAGDIVKGGRQDRVLTISLLVPARSGRVPIASFCVEQGRWAPRGREDASRFASAGEQIPSRAAKLALKQAASGEARTVQATTPRTAPVGVTGGQLNQAIEQRAGGYVSGGGGQGEIWAKVAETQRKLSDKLAAAVASPQSETSLQLSLENQKLKDTRAAYAGALESRGLAEADIVGVVVAINGRINSAEIYPSNGLFRKMWGKVLTAAATEAIGEQGAPNGPAPATGFVRDFMTEAEAAKAAERDLPNKVRLETRSSDKAVYSAVRSAAGVAYHRSLVAK